MPMSASLLRGHRHQSRSLVGLLSRVVVLRHGCRPRGVPFTVSTSRWAHVAAQLAHYEAKVENIRNIGIIAHVDAVRAQKSN